MAKKRRTAAERRARRGGLQGASAVGRNGVNSRETLEDGRDRVTIPVSQIELRLLASASKIFQQEADACKADVERAQKRYEAAQAAHTQELQFVLNENKVRPPDDARVRVDFEKQAIVWETDAPVAPSTPPVEEAPIVEEEEIPIEKEEYVDPKIRKTREGAKRAENRARTRAAREEEWAMEDAARHREQEYFGDR